jgi:hypothetical protein
VYGNIQDRPRQDSLERLGHGNLGGYGIVSQDSEGIWKGKMWGWVVH